MFEDMSKITAFFKRPSTSMTHAADDDDISPENAEPPNKKASKLGSRENTAFLKTVRHWKLGNDTMDMLMRVKIEGPKKQADYHPRAAVNRWWMSGQRQRRPQN